MAVAPAEVTSPSGSGLALLLPRGCDFCWADLMLTPQTRASLSAMAWRRALEMTAPIERDAARTLPVVIDELADRLGSVPAALSETETLDYNDLTALSRRYAGWALR